MAFLTFLCSFQRTKGRLDQSPQHQPGNEATEKDVPRPAMNNISSDEPQPTDSFLNGTVEDTQRGQAVNTGSCGISYGTKCTAEKRNNNVLSRSNTDTNSDRHWVQFEGQSGGKPIFRSTICYFAFLQRKDHIRLMEYLDSDNNKAVQNSSKRDEADGAVERVYYFVTTAHDSGLGRKYYSMDGKYLGKCIYHYCKKFMHDLVLVQLENDAIPIEDMQYSDVIMLSDGIDDPFIDLEDSSKSNVKGEVEVAGCQGTLIREEHCIDGHEGPVQLRVFSPSKNGRQFECAEGDSGTPVTYQVGSKDGKSTVYVCAMVQGYLKSRRNILFHLLSFLKLWEEKAVCVFVSAKPKFHKYIKLNVLAVPPKYVGPSSTLDECQAESSSGSFSE